MLAPDYVELLNYFVDADGFESVIRCDSAAFCFVLLLLAAVGFVRGGHE